MNKAHRPALFATTATIALGAALGMNAMPAMAQNGVAPIEEIIISATKRPQGLQDVPIAVSAYSAEQLQRAGISDIRELTQISPSLFLSSSASETAGAVARIRGVGTTGDNPGLESSVAVFIDGVYRNRTNIGLSELGAISQVEVLRGPQGTLFGRNASAGLINITTKQPGDELTGEFEASYGNFDAVRLTGGISAPLIENKLAARIDGVYFERDGFLKDKVTGEDFNNRDRYLLRGQLLANPTETLELRLIADYADRNEDCCAAVTIEPSPVSAAMAGLLGAQFGSGALPGEDPFERESATTPGRGFQQDVEEWGISLQADWETGIGTLTSITAYRDWQANRSQDIDYTSLDIAFRDEDGFVQQFQTFSQELRLNGQAGWLDWLVGAYYANEDLSLDDAIKFGADFSAFASLLVDLSDGIPGNGLSSGGPWPGYDNLAALLSGGQVTNPFPNGAGAVLDAFDQTSENFAFFTHNIITISDKIELSLGARFTHEKKTLDAEITTNNPGCQLFLGAVQQGAIPSSLLQLPCAPFWNPLVDGQFDGKRTEDRLTGTAAVNFTVSDELSVYASYSRGYKAGGFNLDRGGFPNPLVGGVPTGDSLEFDDETVDSLELGAKYRSPGRSIAVNGSVFYSKFNDFQLNTFNGTNFVVENLPSAETYGVEVEGTWQASENLTLSSGVTYARTQYGTNGFDDPIFAQPSPTNPGGGALFQLPGRTLTNAPEWSVTGAASYEYPVAEDFAALLHADFRYTSGINTGSDLDLEKQQEGVFIVNAKVGFGDRDGLWRIEFWSRNLFDKDYIQVAFDGPLQGSGTARNMVLPNTQVFNAFLAEPRTYGVTLRGAF